LYGLAIATLTDTACTVVLLANVFTTAFGVVGGVGAATVIVARILDDTGGRGPT
jgi:hypothetical protein